MTSVRKLLTACKHCATHIVHADSNMTNMSTHLQRHHPSETTGSTRRKGRQSTLSVVRYVVGMQVKR